MRTRAGSLCLSFVGTVALACAGSAPPSETSAPESEPTTDADPAPLAFEWRTTLNADHPLVGTLIDLRAGAIPSPQDVTPFVPAGKLQLAPWASASFLWKDVAKCSLHLATSPNGASDLLRR